MHAIERWLASKSFVDFGSRRTAAPIDRVRKPSIVKTRRNLKRQQFPAAAASIGCFLCRKRFQFGPGRYDGSHVREWNIAVCSTCIKSNWDGIVLEHHPRLVEHLRANGIPIEFNAKGWLDWPNPLMRCPPR